MTLERWQQLETLFQAALERPAAERAAFLAHACAGDAGLLQEAEKLLASFDAADGFLETPAAEGLQLAASARCAPGQHIAHYELLAALGAGGMGEVYLAHDLQLERRVALKLLPAHFSRDAAWVARFTHEARAASALNHPSILTIYEIGADAETHYIAAEYVAGQTLRQRLSAGALPLRESVNLAAQIAHALSAAHAAGLIHRDIKPENVMVRPDGLVKVLDFGLAKPLGARNENDLSNSSTDLRASSFNTDPAYLFGTLAYASPEQARREELDVRTDIYSLGIVLHELLTGLRPGSDATLLDNAPPALARIVARALAPAREQRYQSAAELCAALEAFEQRLSTNAGSRWRKRAVALGAAALCAALGFWLWQARNGAPLARLRVAPTARLHVAGAAQKLTDLPGQELFPSLAPDGQSIIFTSNQSGNWDIYRQPVSARGALNLTAGAASDDLQPAYAPDGQRIAFHSSRNGGGLFVMSSDGDAVTQLTDAGHNPAWSPDGSELAFAEDNCWDYEGRNTYPSASRLWAVNVTTRARRVVTTHDAVQPNWSPHGWRIAFWGEQKGGHRDIWTVAATGGEPTPVTDDEAIDWNPVWSPAGDQLYFLSNRGGEMNLWRVAIDERTGQLRGAPEAATLPSNNCQHFSFARQGGALVYGQTTRSENLWQLPFDPTTGQVTGAATALTQGLKRYALFALAPDEKRFAYLARGEPQQDLFIADLNGAPLQRLTDDAAQDIIPRWSPDGQWIAFISDRGGKYEIWKVRPDGSGLAQMTHEPGREVIAPAWTPDGRRLSYQIRNVNTYLIDADRPGAEQTPQALPGEPPPGFIPYDWSPDGAYLAGWSPPMSQQQRGLVLYSVATQRYERLNRTGFFPVWLQDSRRLLYRQQNRLFLLDRRSGAERELYALKLPNHIGSHAIARANRRIFFTDATSEADLWLLELK